MTTDGVRTIATNLPGPGTAGEFSLKKLPSREDANVLLGRDQAGLLHLLVGVSAGQPKEPLTTVGVKPIQCEVRPLHLGNSHHTFIDVAFDGNENSELATPFFAFCEDFLTGLKGSAQPAEFILNKTIRRWKRFWSPSRDIQLEWLHGLLGELVVLENLIVHAGPTAVKTWHGSEEPQDFSSNGFAIEVKTGSAIQPVCTITSLAQLDRSSFETMYLVYVQLSLVGADVSLPDVVGRIEAHLASKPELLEEFWRVLAESKYQRHMDAKYADHRRSVVSTNCYLVDDSFPAITYSHLKKNLDERVRSVHYSITLAGETPVAWADERIGKHIVAMVNAA